METLKVEIITPVAKAKVVVKKFITGADAEYIDEILLQGVDIKSQQGEPNLNNFDTSVINKQIHRELEKFVISVDGKTDSVLELLKLPEVDYDFVKNEVSNLRKKK